MSPEAQNYLEEVWGYEKITEVDDKTMEVIRENIIIAQREGQDFYLDEELWSEFVGAFPKRAQHVEFLAVDKYGG